MRYRRWTTTLLAGCALLLSRPAEACGLPFHGSLLQENRPKDANAPYRGRWGEPTVEYSQSWGAVARALQELPPAERFPRIEGRDPWAVEDRDGARWFGNGTDEGAERAAAYSAFVRNPLAREAPEGTPPAAVMYRRAIGWMRRQDVARARAELEQVLALPRAEARWRSAWAAYMLANLETDAVRAAERYAQVRALVRAGAHDPMGLAFASLRTEGLRRQGWDAAGHVRLCHAYERGGGVLDCGIGLPGALSTVRAANVAAQVLRLPDAELARAATDRWLATAVTAQLAYEGIWIQDQDNGERTRKWIAAVEQAGNDAWPGVAAPLAELAYGNADWAGATRWARRGDPSDPRVADVLARLARRRGSADGVVAALRPLAHLSPEHAAWLGEVQLDRGAYLDALETFLRGGDWLDVAFVAERILSADELAAQMPRLLKATEHAVNPADWSICWDVDGAGCDSYHRAALRRDLWAMLARRLARLGRWNEAAEAFAKSAEQGRVIAHVLQDTDMQQWAAGRPWENARAASLAAEAWEEWRTADDESTRGRAALAFLDAAIPRRFELLATEGAPDYYAWDGGAEAPEFADTGREDLARWRVSSGKATADERRRLERSAVESFRDPWVDVSRLPPTTWTGPGTGMADDEEANFRERRYHFLWPLAAYAWVAAGHLPDADVDKVQLLCRGGHLIKNRDTFVADRFYKRMVWEGRPDPVALAADAYRWFPIRDDESRACTTEKWYWEPLPSHPSASDTPEPAAQPEQEPGHTDAREAERMLQRSGAFLGTSVLLIGVRMILRALFRS